MFAFLGQPEYKPAETGPEADARYRRMRWQVFLGAFILANWVVGWVAQAAGWSWTFLLLVAACPLSIFFMALTCGHERGGNAAEK